MCAESGIADYLYKKVDNNNRIVNNKPPIWMGRKEKEYWKIGYNYARQF